MDGSSGWRRRAPEGQEWTADRIAAGDTVCAANQHLRLQNPDLVQEIEDNPFWTDEVAAPIAPRSFVDDIEVPGLPRRRLAGRADRRALRHDARPLHRHRPLLRHLVNGLHTESIGAGVVPPATSSSSTSTSPSASRRSPPPAQVAPVLSSVLFGTDQVTLPPDRFAGQTYEQALATFEAEPPIQVLFEEGAADGAVPGAPQPRWIESFDAWPVPGRRPARGTSDPTVP